jgi:hypothetical protein
MSGISSNDSSTESLNKVTQFEQLHTTVEQEFEIEDSFVEYNIPTFYVKLRQDSKTAFLKLIKHLDPLGFIPVLRKRNGKTVLQIMEKPATKPSRPIKNIALFFATLGTVLLAGYFQSQNIIETVTFAAAIIAILGSHEMGHKIAADKHHVEATYPYFIPGPPPIGTFGAVIQQKSLPPNKDALFDIGCTGPIVGFLVAIVVTIIGLPLSSYAWIPEGSFTLPAPLLFSLIGLAFPPLGAVPLQTDSVLVILLHPVAFAGWVGMIVTVLNLIPVGMFDGGHVARTFFGKTARKVISYVAIITFLILGLLIWEAFIVWAIIAIVFSSMRHPGPLDDASKVTTWRKLAALGIAIIFFLSFPFLI